LALQGVHPSLALEFPNATLVTKAAGDTCPVPLIMAAAHGILKAIAPYLAQYTLDIYIQWPNAPWTIPRAIPNLARFITALRAPSHSILACPKARAQAVAKVAKAKAKARAAQAQSGKRKADHLHTNAS